METDLSVLAVGALLAALGCGDPEAADVRPDAAGAPGPDARASRPDAAVAPGCVAWRGVRVLGGPADDEATDVAIDADGGVLVTGYDGADNSFATVIPDGESRGVLHRFAADGRADTHVVLDHVGPDALDRFALASDGRLHVAGRTRGALGGDPVDPSRLDVVAGRLEGDAIVESFRTGVPADDRPTALAIADDGTTVIGGHVEPDIPTNYVARWEDAFVATHDGHQVRRVTSTLDAPDVVLGADVRGDVLVVGGAVQSGTQRGPFVSRLDRDPDRHLAVLWSNRLSGISVDAVTWLTVLDTGDVLAVGAVTQATGHDVIVYRLDGASGAAVVVTTFGGEGAEWPTAAVRLASGELVIVGETAGGLTRPSLGEYDVFALWLSADGAPLRVEQLGSTGDDRPAGVAVDPCGNVVVAGYTSGAIGDAPGHGRRDAFVAVLASNEQP